MNGSGPATNLDDALINFRTTWLRAVALAWSDESFLHDLLHPEDTQLSHSGLKNPDALDVISDRFSIEHAPFRDAIRLTVIDDQYFEWIGDDWSWSPAAPYRNSESSRDDSSSSSTHTKTRKKKRASIDEGLIIKIPLHPPLKTLKDPRKRAAALADYYRARPSIFTSCENKETDVPGSLLSFTGGSASFISPAIALVGNLATILNKTNGTNPPRIFNNLNQSDGQLLFGGITFLEFQVALMSIMAKAWENAAFNTLILNPDNLKESFQYVHGYAPPWRMIIQIAHDQSATWQDSEDAGDSRWTNLSRHEMALRLPQPPQRPEDWSVALAAYNAAGAGYFATCCRQ